MALADWTFDSQANPPATPAFVTQIATPGLLGDSLRVTAQQAFSTAVLAGALNPALHPIGYSAGQIECCFLKQPGTNQREHGVFCLSSLANPTLTTAQMYTIQIRDGTDNQLGVYKLPNGLVDAGSAMLLRSYTIGSLLNTQNQLISLRLKWLSGVFATTNGVVRLQVWIGVDSAGVPTQRLTPDALDTTNLLYTGMREGFFVRTRSAADFIDSYFDNIRLSRIQVAQLGGTYGA